MASEELTPALRRLGLLHDGETPSYEPLTGGVSSDIVRVDVAGRRFCVKRALSRLKVAAVWEVTVERNAAEAAWLRQVGDWFPASVPEVLGEDRQAGLFAMAYLPPANYPVWKQELLSGRIDPSFAAAVGARLGAIHARSAEQPGIAEHFANQTVFEPIRLEPYLRATASRHPELANRLNALADATAAMRLALMHGDVSPKNILCGPSGPVFIDAECACWGDPAFDLAFCLNHLLLKASWMPEHGDALLASFDALRSHYLRSVSWEPADAFERRCAALLPALALARIDGKSPVEYIDSEAVRNDVRQRAMPLIERPVASLAGVRDAWCAP